MEDYKKKYGEALERARTLHKLACETSHKNTRMAIEELFPELKESEDEMVRKHLLKHFRNKTKEDWNGMPVKNILAWLEKQDPKKHEEELEKAYKTADEVQYRKGYEDAKREFEKQGEKSNPYSGVSFEYNGHIWGMCARDNGVDILFDKQLFKHLEKQGEHKPYEFDETNARRMFIKALERVEEQNNKGYKLTDCDKNSWWEDFKAYCGYVEMQKPTDKVEPKFKVGDIITNKKSKDTVKIVQILHDSYCYSGWDGAATVHSDFRISEQDNYELVEQRPAWSEEDEYNLNWIINDYERALQTAISSVWEGRFKMLVDWLKSFKERYTWKPSDEQMKQLGLIAEQNKDNMIGKELMSLYQELKKLKGE